MSHSHLALQHLIHKLDSPGPRLKRASGPVWLAEFVDQIAELFEPYIDMGRVGYECAPSSERWEISMFLGRTEVVGGKVDGQVRAVAFQFDVSRLETIFDRIDECRWSAFPVGAMAEEAEPSSGERSSLVVLGRYRENAVRLRVYCTPPTESTPGLRQHADGSWEAV